MGEQEKWGQLSGQSTISAELARLWTTEYLLQGQVHNRRHWVWPVPEPPPQGAKMTQSRHGDIDSQPGTKSLYPRETSSDPFNYYSGEMYELVCSGIGEKQSNIPRTISSWCLEWIIFVSGFWPHQPPLAPRAGWWALLCVLKAVWASLYLCTHFSGL